MTASEHCDRPHENGVNLAGRLALVTGATSGIGWSIARALALQGADLVVHEYTDQHTGELVADLTRLGRKAVAFTGDFSVPGGGGRLASELSAAGLSPDIVVHNASLQVRKPLDELRAEDVAAQMHVGYGAVVELVGATVGGMKERGWGRILTVGSVQQLRPNPALTVYANVKAALANFVQAIAAVYAPHGITANNIAPGMIDTSATRFILDNPVRNADMLRQIPAGYVGEPQDCAGLAAFLCGPDGRYITGQTIFIDGGLGLNTKASFIAQGAAGEGPL
ncbi:MULTISPECIES: SDR family NAD(P)-dependent oxidoreductase [unclassified Mesorhizobium]|uniref:SDR family NAD(P)-dependent oxidoreductase n=1 Tax=unclassified Mesorhizobium TaxID=325217 RepID=UPI0015E444FF|nr:MULTISPECIES: SDR family oxidoreductase [unclassified Mesorhizobium]MBZ9811280.1 SDR family oxidoreductase [Mesorhizobium sp. ESP-6-2]